jgi:hypothetical protein
VPVAGAVVWPLLDVPYSAGAAAEMPADSAAARDTEGIPDATTMIPA